MINNFKASKLAGTIWLRQEPKGTKTFIEGKLTGLPEGSKGFHIHASKVGTDCASTNGHFNPKWSKTHGAPGATDSHVGDLGNVIFDNK